MTFLYMKLKKRCTAVFPIFKLNLTKEIKKKI